MEKPTEPIQIRVSKKLLEMLKKKAKENDTNMSEYVRSVLRKQTGLVKGVN